MCSTSVLMTSANSRTVFSTVFVTTLSVYPVGVFSKCRSLGCTLSRKCQNEQQREKHGGRRGWVGEKLLKIDISSGHLKIEFSRKVFHALKFSGFMVET